MNAKFINCYSSQEQLLLLLDSAIYITAKCMLCRTDLHIPYDHVIYSML